MMQYANLHAVRTCTNDYITLKDVTSRIAAYPYSQSPLTFSNATMAEEIWNAFHYCARCSTFRCNLRKIGCFEHFPVC